MALSSTTRKDKINAGKNGRIIANKAKNKAKHPIGDGPATAVQSTSYTCARCGRTLSAMQARFTGVPSGGQIITCNNDCHATRFDTGLLSAHPEVMAKKWPTAEDMKGE